jgi:hypothetical protein
VQTYARLGEPPISTRTRWRFGSNRRFVATIEWLRLFPKPGFFPQIAHTLAIAGRSVAAYPAWEAFARICEKRSAISSAARTASAALSIRASA